jgi:hypothetical protein
MSQSAVSLVRGSNYRLDFCRWAFYMLHYDALDDGVCETADFIYTFMSQYTAVLKLDYLLN